MKTLRFKTNINCGGCVATVRPYLNAEPTIERWAVDTDDHNKILTVSGEALEEEWVRALVSQAGFRIEPVT